MPRVGVAFFLYCAAEPHIFHVQVPPSGLHESDLGFTFRRGVHPLTLMSYCLVSGQWTRQQAASWTRTADGVKFVRAPCSLVWLEAHALPAEG